jgi:hypothetical protein
MVDGVPSEVDTTGPHIDLRFVDTGTTVGPGAQLRIALEDEHGIDVTGHTVPNTITLTVDDQSRVDLTDQFRYDPGSFTRGTILYPLPGLTSGIHVAEVSAADNFAEGIAGRRNRSRASLQFTMVAGGYTPGPQAMNFPNPFVPTGGTQFVINNLVTAADLEIWIYAVDGTLVRALQGSGGPGQVQVAWDGRDAGGGIVSNGIYLYRIKVVPSGIGVPFQLTGRAAAMR